MDDLERRVRELQSSLGDPSWSAQHEQSLRTSVERRLVAKRALVRPLWGGTLAVAAALLLWVGISAFRQREVAAPLPASSAKPAPGVVFADGSRVAAVSDDMRVDTEQQDLTRIQTRLVRGTARFEVVPNPAREFIVYAGSVKVAVLGTVFTVAHEGTRVHVAVMAGKVKVDWGNGSATLVQDSEGVFPPPGDVEIEAERTEETTRSSERPRQPHEAGKCRWVELAKTGDYRAAYSGMVAAGDGAVADVPEELLLAADVARRAGHVDQAARHLERMLSRYPNDTRAAVAAFTLGRIRLQLGRPGPAGAAFEQVFASGGALAEDALYRAVLAWQQSGNSAKASKLKQRYLATYPGGRYVEALQKVP